LAEVFVVAAACFLAAFRGISGMCNSTLAGALYTSFLTCPTAKSEKRQKRLNKSPLCLKYVNDAFCLMLIS